MLNCTGLSTNSWGAQEETSLHDKNWPCVCILSFSLNQFFFSAWTFPFNPWQVNFFKSLFWGTSPRVFQKCSQTVNWISFVHTSFKKFQGLGATTSLQKPCWLPCSHSFPHLFFLLAFRKLLFEISFWSTFVCIYMHLAWVVVLFVFSSFGHKRDFLVSFQTDSFLLVFSHAKFSGGMPFEIFLLSNVHVLWASNTASLNNFCAARKHLTLLSAFSI